MFLMSYLIGMAFFCFVKFAIDRKKEKKRLFKVFVSADEKSKSKRPILISKKLFGRFGLVLGYDNPVVVLAGIHLMSLGASLICGLNQIMAAMVSVLAPGTFIFYAILRDRRQRTTLENQVELLLTSIANSLYGNPAITNALREAEEVAEQPMKKEIAIALTEIDHGCDINSALERFSSRVDSEIVGLAVDGILICRETGGSLSRLLEGLSSVARTRGNLKGKIKALTAQQKTTATFVAIIPIAFVLFSQAFSPAYQESLRTPTGVGVTVYALISVAIGFVWLNKMTDILRVRNKG